MNRSAAKSQLFTGLFDKNANAIPLLGVSLNIDVLNAASKVQVSQRYHNKEAIPIEAVYSFPLEESSAVCGFEVEIGDRTIIGKVEEKDKAFEKYDDAMAEGHGAFLLDQERPNIFTASVGNLLPGQEAIVRITYVAELQRTGDSLRLLIPTTISPRYIPQEKIIEMDPSELDSIAPPTVLGPVPYGLRLKVNIKGSENIQSVESPSHPVRVSLAEKNAKVELSGDDTQLDQDFVLTIQFANFNKPSVIITRDREDGYVAMLNFVPQIASTGKRPQEVVFLLDRSGSMGGESIEQAKRALLLCLKSMSEGDRFNIVGFGSTYENLYESSAIYNQKSLSEATAYISNIDADLGGTEIYRPLRAILLKESELPLQIVLITDGEVGNEKAIIELAEGCRGKCRIFSFGIGRGVNEYFVKELARATDGAAEFIHPGERMEPKVLKQFARIVTPCYKKIEIDWGKLKVDFTAPEEKGHLFSGDVFIAYGKLKKLKHTNVKLMAESPDGKHCWDVEIDPQGVVEDEMIPILMARAAIRDLEGGRSSIFHLGSRQKSKINKRAKNAIIELGCRYQLVSSATSFVAIESRQASDSHVRAELRRIPVVLTQAWGGIETSVKNQTAYRMASSHIDMPMSSTIDCSDAFSTSKGINACSSKPYPLTMDELEIPTFIRRQVDPDDDLLMMLTNAQLADGTWELDKKFSEIVGVEYTLLISAAEKLNIDLDRASLLVATLVALHILNTKLMNRESEWKLLAQKAIDWVEKQTESPPEGFGSYKEWIEDLCSDII